jgi:nitrate/nitrite transporter NarK
VCCAVAGWGNTGAGAALLLMPLLFEAWSRVVFPDIAWRIAIFVPGVVQLVLGVLVLTATDDSPLGSFPQLRCAAALQHCSGAMTLSTGAPCCAKPLAEQAVQHC